VRLCACVANMAPGVIGKTVAHAGNLTINELNCFVNLKMNGAVRIRNEDMMSELCEE
jgi:hypothetical protein